MISDTQVKMISDTQSKTISDMYNTTPNKLYTHLRSPFTIQSLFFFTNTKRIYESSRGAFSVKKHFPYSYYENHLNNQSMI